LYHAAPFTPAAAGTLAALAIGTIYLVQIVSVSLGMLDLVASMVSDAVVIVVVIVYARRRGITRADLGVRRAPARFIAAAVLLGIAMWYLTAWLVVLVDPPGDTKQLQRLVEQTPLGLTLIALTIFPAVAEELVFRGILTRGLAPRFRAAGAIAISAAVFGLYHLLPPQVLSTFVLGLVLGFLTLRANSIVPSIIVHALNNTIAIVLPRDEVPAAGAWITANPAPMFAGSIACVACGIALAAKGPA
jgi:membrane protease YdiL (CAAX protease family)